MNRAVTTVSPSRMRSTASSAVTILPFCIVVATIGSISGCVDSLGVDETAECGRLEDSCETDEDAGGGPPDAVAWVG